MVDVETKTKREKPAATAAAVWTPEPAPRETPGRHLRLLPFVITAAALAGAGTLSWGMWQVYMGAPWTRGGTVRAMS
jgi:multidrug resistance efflux pump